MTLVSKSRSCIKSKQNQSRVFTEKNQICVHRKITGILVVVSSIFGCIS